MSGTFTTGVRTPDAGLGVHRETALISTGINTLVSSGCVKIRITSMTMVKSVITQARPTSGGTFMISWPNKRKVSRLCVSSTVLIIVSAAEHVVRAARPPFMHVPWRFEDVKECEAYPQFSMCVMCNKHGNKGQCRRLTGQSRTV